MINNSTAIVKSNHHLTTNNHKKSIINNNMSSLISVCLLDETTYNLKIEVIYFSNIKKTTLILINF
jgi:hypothetical protein